MVPGDFVWFREQDDLESVSSRVDYHHFGFELYIIIRKEEKF